MTDRDDANLIPPDQTPPVEKYGATEPNDLKVNIDQRETDRAECLFKDGKRKIDFILVYEETIAKAVSDKRKKEISEMDEKQVSRLSSNERNTGWRNRYLENLQKIGLESEFETINDGKKTTWFVKLHVPWEVLCSYAEDIRLRAPLQIQPSSADNASEQLFSCLHIPNLMALDVPNQPAQYFMCQFKQAKLNRFIGSDNKNTFFTDRDRIRMTYEILSRTTYGRKKKAEVGVDRLVEDNLLSAAFPLHDGGYELLDPALPPEELNHRQILFEYWAKWGRWFKYQPLNHIRDYFGEKIGIYFAWLGFYTAWLLPASVVGLMVFLFAVFTMGANPSAIETCNSGTDFYMCPLCDNHGGCGYWYLSKLCPFKMVSYLFDNPGTVFFSIFMSFWAVTFLEYWKRKTAYLAYTWDCMDFECEEERPRAEYIAKCNTYEKNPITGIQEPYFPKRSRTPRIISGLGVVIMMICIVIIFIVAVIMYRVLITLILFKLPSGGFFHQQASLVASISASFVNLIIILLLSKVYERLAKKLTQWEMHRTQTEYENQLTFKVFIFQFVNLYSSIFYIGFIKGKFIGYPGKYRTMMGLRAEECQNGDCLIELALNLGVVMVGKQVINNIQELVVPKLKGMIHKWKIGKIIDKEVKTRWEQDYELIANEGLFEEYLEMVMQFGFITIFVAAFPLAPLFALLNNWLEIRLDAHKFVSETRRPVPDRCQDIGVWFLILDTLAQLAVISNAFLIAFTSDFLPRQLYSYMYKNNLEGYVNFTLAWAPNGTMTKPCRYRDFRDPDGNHTMFYWKLMVARLAFIIIFEHIVFGICKLIDIAVPDIPESLDVKIKREGFLAKQALADAKTELDEQTEEEESKDPNI